MKMLGASKNLSVFSILPANPSTPEQPPAYTGPGYSAPQAPPGFPQYAPGSAIPVAGRLSCNTELSQELKSHSLA